MSKLSDPAKAEAILNKQLTYISQSPHNPRAPGKTCGRFERYTESGKCVYCARTEYKGYDNLAKAGERVLTKSTPKQERIEAAVNAYVKHEISVMRCSHLYSLTQPVVREALKERGLTRDPMFAHKNKAQPIENKHEKINRLGAALFAPRVKAMDSARGNA